MESTLLGFSSLRGLPIWPFFRPEGLPIFPSQIQPLDRLDQNGLSPPQRTKPSQRVVDFSIRSILALDGSEGGRENQEEPSGGAVEWGGNPQGYAWIRCTRFKPPAVPKTKRVGSPRPTSRSPRVPFSATQLGTLERSFQQARYLSTGQVRDVALLLGLTENRVKIWFQNRRARERRDFLKQHSSRSVGVKQSPFQGRSPPGWH